MNNLKRDGMLGAAALALTLAAACAPQLAQTEYSPTEQQWQQYLATHYPEWRPPQSVPPWAGAAAPEPELVPDFVPGGEELAPLPPPEELPPPPDLAGAQKYTVQKGDSLWKIAAKFYGKGSLWPRILEANRALIPDPGNLKAGIELLIPGVEDQAVVPK